MTKKRILFLTHVLPYPLDAGAKVRAYYMLRHLAQRHSVTLFSMVRETDPESAADHLAEFCDDVGTMLIRRSIADDVRALLASLRTGLPVLIVRDRLPAFRACIQRLVQDKTFDAIHVDQIKTAQHVEGLTDLPRLMDMHNVYYEMIEGMARLATSPWRRWLLRREARTMARYEGRACGVFNEIISVTEDNARRLRDMTGGARRVTAIPICVDPTQTPMIAPSDEARDLLCLGAMFYPPNVDGVLWFVRDILPKIRTQVADVRLRIVGPRPDRAILRAAAGDSLIQVTGHVEDLTPHWAATAAAVVPLRAGSGMRVKILDAMARGIPVVSTRLGAEGISARHDEHLLLADSAAELASSVVRLLRDVDLRRRLARDARRLVETQYDWRQRYAEVDAVYERLLAAGESVR
jgi:glycosyltransferase involved in cell wall biosynthesis